MAIERTLSIVKPDGVQGKHIGDILARFEKSGLRVIALRMTHLSPVRRSRSTRCTRHARFSASWSST